MWRKCSSIGTRPIVHIRKENQAARISQSLRRGPLGRAAQNSWPGGVRMTSVVVVSYDIAIAQRLQLHVAAVAEEISKTRTMHDAIGPQILDNRVAGGVTNDREVIIEWPKRWVCRAARHLLLVLVAKHMHCQQKLALVV